MNLDLSCEILIGANPRLWRGLLDQITAACQRSVEAPTKLTGALREDVGEDSTFSELRSGDSYWPGTWS